jgi:glycosyltransferase involved in cell wall biosynthesis
MLTAHCDVYRDSLLVSCIMPTADRRGFVPRAIAQFLAQDYPDRELLIVDDGTDRIEDLVPEDPRVRYIRLEQRLVLGAKRNLACEQARGELIVHWDDDDWSAPWRLRYQVEQLTAAGADVGGLDRVLFHDPATGEAWQYEYPRTGAPWVYGATLIYTRAFWHRNPFPLMNVGEDSRFVWASVPKRILAHDDDRFFVATVHPANTSRKDTRGYRWRRIPIATLDEVMGPESRGAR